MKKYLFRSLVGAAAVAVLLALFGCDSIKPDRCKDCVEEKDMRHVTVNLGGEARIVTKVYGVTDTLERVVRNSRLYVFAQDGYQINNYDASSGQVDFYLTDGTYDFVAVCNLADLPGTEVTREELYQLVVPIEKNTLEPEVGGFVMVGTLPGHIIKADEKITVEVRRMASKVSFTVRNGFVDEMAGYPFLVDAIYMTNVPGINNLGLTYTKPKASDIWYNRMVFEPDSARKYPVEMLYGDFHKILAPGDTVVSGHVFYIYPNGCEDNRDIETWTSRCTRFVVEAHVNGIRTFYATTLYFDGAGVKPNKHYHIDLTIKGWGTDHPEVDPKDMGSMMPVFVVDEWRDGGGVIAQEL